LLGKERFAGVDIRVRVKGGGRVSQIYGMLLASSWLCVVYTEQPALAGTYILANFFCSAGDKLS